MLGLRLGVFLVLFLFGAAVVGVAAFGVLKLSLALTLVVVFILLGLLSLAAVCLVCRLVLGLLGASVGRLVVVDSVFSLVCLVLSLALGLFLLLLSCVSGCCYAVRSGRTRLTSLSAIVLDGTNCPENYD